MDFKYRIRDLRRQKGLNGDQLGDLVHLSRFAVSGWENGKAYPSVDVCFQLCDIFECSMDYLLGLSDIRKRPTENDSRTSLLNSYDALTPELKKELNSYMAYLEYLNKNHMA